MRYILQIIHRPEEGGENVIETTFEALHQAEAEARRHKRRPHKAECETYVFQEVYRAV